MSVHTTVREVTKPIKSHASVDSGHSTSPSKTTTTKNIGGGEAGATLHFDIFP